MVNVTIKTKTRTIQEKINDWKELKNVLLKYNDYISFIASSPDKKPYRKKEEERDNEERHTR